MQQPASGPATSASLLLRIRNVDDADSWQRFEAVYAPVIRSYCRRRGFQSSDIDDIAQDVMTAVAGAIKNFEYQPEKGKFRSWLATVTANKLRNYATKSKVKREQLIEYADQLASAPDSDSHWTDVFMQQIFAAAKQQVQLEVEEKTWECFRMTWLENIPAADVAANLEMPIHSVYVNKSRVLKRLENEFLMLSDDYPLAKPD